MAKKTKAEESTVFSIRMSKTTHSWLVEMSERHDVEVAQLIRWAIESLRQYIEIQGGALHLPIDLRKMWTLVDSDFRSQVEAAAKTEGVSGKPERKIAG